MRIQIFTSALLILGIGLAGFSLLPKADAMGVLDGTLRLGGGILICGFFTIRMLWHGIIGAGILALLGTSRGIINLPGLFKFLTGDRTHGPLPLMELLVTVTCLTLMLSVVRALLRERTRRMLEAEE